MRTRSQDNKTVPAAKTLTHIYQVTKRESKSTQVKTKLDINASHVDGSIVNKKDVVIKSAGTRKANTSKPIGISPSKGKTKAKQQKKQQVKVEEVNDSKENKNRQDSTEKPSVDTNPNSFTTSKERNLPLDLMDCTYTPTRDIPSSISTKLLIRIPTPADFSFSGTVASYGYFCLPPQSWIPSADVSNPDGGVYERPLRYGHNHCETCYARITFERTSVDGKDIPELVIEEVVYNVTPDTRVVFSALSSGELAQIGMQVTRMFRLDEDIAPFHTMQPEAKVRGFGRLYRSPTTFEDMIKSITNINMTWAGTVRMCALLCYHYGKKGAFPTPQEMPTSAEELKTKCKVGYRGDRMVQVAALFLTPPDDLSAFNKAGEPDSTANSETDPTSTPAKQKAAAKRAQKTQEKLEQRNAILVLVKRLVQADNPRLVVPDSQKAFALIKTLHGFGDFAASNVMQLMGYYDHVAADSETVRLFKEHHVKEIRTHTVGVSNYNELFKIARKYYDQFAPYQFLFYWFDLWKNYEEKSGKKATKWFVERLVIPRAQTGT